MKVHEVVTRLLECDPDLDVVFCSGDHNHNGRDVDYITVDTRTIGVMSSSPTDIQEVFLDTSFCGS